MNKESTLIQRRNVESTLIQCWFNIDSTLCACCGVLVVICIAALANSKA